MRWWNVLRARLRALFGRDAVIGDIDEELRAHVDMLTEENLRRGMAPAEARAAALREFGNPARVRDTAYDVRGGGMLEILWQDLRFGGRMLRKHPGVTLSAVLTMALGIGATSAVFSIVNPLLLRPLPFRDPDRLITIYETCLPKFPRFSVSPGNYYAWREQSPAFAGMAAAKSLTLTLTGDGDPERLAGRRVTTGYFELFGVRPVLGRDFLPEEDAPGHSDVIILSQGVWQRRFGGDPGILNRTVVLDGKPYAVVGVMPADLHPSIAVDMWTPAAFTAEDRQSYGRHSLQAFGRLAPNATLEAAQAELNEVAQRLEHDHPETNVGWRVKMSPLSETLLRDVRPMLGVLSAAVAFLLLIACANVASLLLGRAATREREVAVRVALGAGRWRILRQLASESALLSVIGGAVGLALGTLGVDLLLSLAPRGLAGMTSVKLDVPLVAFAFGASLIAGLVVGLAPALQAFKVDVNGALKEGARGSAGGGRARVRRVLVAVEVASCVLLLVGAGLLLRSLGRLLAVDPGFNADSVTTVALDLPQRKYPDDAARRNYAQRAMQELSALPGARVVAAAHTIPFSLDWVFGFSVDGSAPDAKSPSANFYAVSPEYFHAMGIRLLAGRAFTDRDGPDAPPAIIIDERLARQFFPDGDAVGRRITFDAPRQHEIVGVVANVKEYGLDGPSSYEMYTPLAQDPFSQVVLIVRGEGDVASLGPAIQGRLRAIDADQPLGPIRPLAQLVSDSVSRQRFAVVLLTIFAGVALLLAIVGIYGVISDAVTQRSREIGIRLALGARSSDCIRLMMRQGAWPVAVGLGVGLLGALAATRVMASLLYEVSATDPATLGGVTALLGAVALVASYLPARRVARVDPMVALRSE
jgi:putative ABC transport system permease protein